METVPIQSIVLMLLAAAVAALLGLQRWSVRRARPEARTGALMLWCGTVIVLSNALQLIVPDVQAKLFLARAQLGGVIPIPLLWFYLTLQFTGQDRQVTRMRLVLLCAPVAGTLLLLLTDPVHHLMIVPGWWLEGNLQRLSFSYGAPVWIYALYGHSQVLLGAGILTWRMIRYPGFRWQGTVLLLAVAATVAANVADLVNSGPRPAFDLTPLALLFSVPLFLFALVRLQRADLLPVARGSVIETMRDGLLVVDGQHRVLDLNPAAEEIFGVRLPQVRGKGLTGIWPSWREEPGGLSAPTRPVETVRFDHRGDGRDFEITSSKVRDWRGHATCQVLVLRDVTARSRAAAALRASEQRLRSMFESTRVGVYQIAPDGQILFCNQAMAHMLGFDTSGEFRRHGADTASDRLAATLRDGTQGGDEVQGRLLSWRMPNGIVLHLREHARAVRGVDGALQYYEGTIEDLTELVGAQEDLERKARYLQAMNRVITAGSAVKDTPSMMAACLESSLEALRLPAGGLWAGRDRRLVGISDDLCQALDGSGAAFDQAVAVDDVSGLTADSPLGSLKEPILAGGLRSVLAHPIITDGARIGGLAFGAREPHGWRQEEIALAEAVAKEVAAGLHRHQMVEQTRHQERLAAVGQLAAGIAHDFNNFLATIVLQTGMLGAEPDLSARGVARTKIILEQSRRATGLITQVLDFSRRSVLEMQPVDLQDFVEESVRLLERMLPENIRTVFERGEGDYFVQGDKTRIQQVLLNLATNARDAMPHGGTVTISLSRITLGPHDPRPFPGMAKGAWLVLKMSDTGVGMTEEVRAHLFEPFFTTKPPGKGTGLGLSQVYGIVKQHDGYIDVASEVGVGTTFTMYFRGLQAGVDPMDLASPIPQAGSGERILLAEDDDATRQAVAEVLEQLGYRVECARDGREALELFDRDPDRFRLVISDVIMPELGGEGLCAELIRRRPGLSVILVSGYPLGTTGRLLDPAGVVRLKKPLDVHTLAAAVRAALGQDRGSEPGRSSS